MPTSQVSPIAVLVSAILVSCASSHPSEVTHANTQHARPAAPRVMTGALARWEEPRPLAPIRIALLLPLQGEWATPATAVRDGVMEARTRSGPRLEVRSYDTGASETSFLEAYRRAVHEGARAIIGPLRMENVAVLARQGAPPVAVVALNAAAAQAPPNLYYLAPSQEDEGRSAARTAIERGARRVVALIRDDETSSRTASAFAQELKTRGARLVALHRLPMTSTSDRETVSKLMAAFDLQPRDIAATDIASRASPGAEGRSFDTILVITESDRWPTLFAELRRYRDADVPIYAISSGASETDLSMAPGGVFACDMPAILERMVSYEAPPTWSAPLAPDEPALQRLRAVGADSYAVASAMVEGRWSAGAVLDGETGTLTLEPGGNIGRAVPCAPMQIGTELSHGG